MTSPTLSFFATTAKGMEPLLTDELRGLGISAIAETRAGDERWSLAWSLMAGAGYQVSERLIVDFGYRYIDMGSVKSTRVDNLGFTNPPVVVDDITAHEFKIGLRYHFGG